MLSWYFRYPFDNISIPISFEIWISGLVPLLSLLLLFFKKKIHFIASIDRNENLYIGSWMNVNSLHSLNLSKRQLFLILSWKNIYIL